MLMRFFTIKRNAELFAMEHKGKIEVKYDWDYLRNKMIKFYIVKF